MERCDVLSKARECYERGAEFRRRRLRHKRFTYGEQWDDTVRCSDGRVRTEGALATMRGRTPLTNNMIRNLVKTIVGHFRTEQEEQGARVEELDARTLEEFLISGMAVQRVGPEGEVEHVSPARFFHSAFMDPRGRDMELAGMLHDWSLAETLMRFSDGDRRRAAEIKRIYGNGVTGAPGLARPGGADFGLAEPGRCRVIEVWTLEAREQLAVHDPMEGTVTLKEPEEQRKVDALNRKRLKQKLPRVECRWQLTQEWHGRWLTPEGTVMRHVKAERPPFALRLYPMVDGEVHSFVEDVIDQQKYINRLITHVDNMMSTSAKGVLLFPQDQIGDEMEWSDVADAWASYDGIIPYNPRPGVQGPQQVVTNPAPCGAYELLALQMRMMEEVSGVSQAYRGRSTGGSGNSAQLYEAQVRYSGVALADLFATFGEFRRERDELRGESRGG